jgi:signal transduction histidine kinase
MRSSGPLWFGLVAIAVLIALGVYVGLVYQRAERLREMVDSASTVVAAAFEIERGSPQVLAGSPAYAQQAAFAERRLDAALERIERRGDERFRAEARWMRQEHVAAVGLQQTLRARGQDAASERLLGRLRVTLSEISDTAVMLFRVAHDARASSVRLLYVIAMAVTLAALVALGALIVLYQRYVAHRDRARVALERANATLRTHADEQDQLVYAASHDLKEPLRMVSSFTDLLERELGESATERARGFFNMIRDGAARMRRLVDGISAAALADRPVGRAEDVDLRAEAIAVAALFAEPLAAAGGRLAVGDLPRAHVDRVRFAQVLQNLIGNSIKYRSPERQLAVSLEGERAEAAWVITVRDNGLGIAPQYLGEIFRLFRRLHGPEIEGTGAGLAICKRIVESWGGSIRVESVPGTGSAFRFTIPDPPDA